MYGSRGWHGPRLLCKGESLMEPRHPFWLRDGSVPPLAPHRPQALALLPEISDSPGKVPPAVFASAPPLP